MPILKLTDYTSISGRGIEVGGLTVVAEVSDVDVVIIMQLFKFFIVLCVFPKN